MLLYPFKLRMQSKSALDRISIAVPLLLQSCLFGYKILIEREFEQNAFYTDCIGTVFSDTASYIEPMEEWIRSGNYTSERYGDYRMPGYGLVYLIFRMLFERVGALNALVFFQLICSIATTALIPLLAMKLTRSIKIFWRSLLLCNLMVCATLYNHYLLTESLVFSCTVWILWLRINNKWWLLTGILLAWLIFIKPFMICFVPILFIQYAFSKPLRIDEYRMGLLRQFKNRWTHPEFFQLFMPLILALAIWTGRNYQLHGKFRPFNNGVYYPEIEASGVDAIFEWVSAFGGSAQWWKPDAEISSVYFRSDSIHAHLNRPLPSRAFTQEYNVDSLYKLQRLADQISFDHPDHQNASEIRSLCKGWKSSLEKEKSLLYWVGGRLIILKNFLLQSGSDRLFNQKFSELNLIKKAIKIISSLDFVVVLLIGFFGSAFYFVIHRKHGWLALSAFFLVFSIPVLFGADEHRYLVPAIPFLLLISSIFSFQKGEIR